MIPCRAMEAASDNETTLDMRIKYFGNSSNQLRKCKEKFFRLSSLTQ